MEPTSAVDLLICIACEKDDPVLVSMLVQSGADVNSCCGSGRTALHLASERNFHGVLVVLLENDVDVNALDENGDSALHKTAQCDSRDAANVLLMRGGNPNSENSLDNHTPLHDAGRYNNPEIARLFLDRGALIDVKDSDGCTPLVAAVQAGSKEALVVFLDQRANPNEPDLSGRTALIWAATKTDDTRIAELLLTAGANVALKDDTGHTALSRARLLGHQKTVAFLEGYSTSHSGAREDPGIGTRGK